jgi:hypothetical protein
MSMALAAALAPASSSSTFADQPFRVVQGRVDRHDNILLIVVVWLVVVLLVVWLFALVVVGAGCECRSDKDSVV